MRLASLFWFLFSTGGLLIVLVVSCAGLFIWPRSRLPRFWLLTVVLTYTIISTYPIPHAVNHWWAREYGPLTKADVPPGPTLVVLLGSGSYTAIDWTNGRTAVPDPIGLERTLEAARVYKLIEAAWVVSSGGFVRPESNILPPGQAMRDELVRLGVPASRIIVKNDATDTHDEAQSVAALLPTLHVQHVVLVTSVVHMRRAVAVFRRAGVEVIPAVTREDAPQTLSWPTRFLPSETGLYEAAVAAHELGGFAYYWIRGWR